MKTAIMILVGLELAGLVLSWLGLALGKPRSDLAGQGMAGAYTVIGSILALLLMAPAFAMGYYGKLPWLALGLAVVAGFFVMVAIASSL